MRPKICKMCGKTETKENPVEWWKCCPKHTTETGPDVVCLDCARACSMGLLP